MLTIDAPPQYDVAQRGRDLLYNLTRERRGEAPERRWLSERAVLFREQATRDTAEVTPAMVRGGRFCARLLALLPVEIDEFHLFAANGLMPAFTEEESRSAWDYLATQPSQFGHSAHISLDYAKLLRVGISGLLQEIATAEELNVGENETKAAFYQGLRYALQGLLVYADRHRYAAESLLAETVDPVRRGELQRMVAALQQVPYQPAASFYEAIQSFLLFHFAIRTHEADAAVGRLDYFLDPYYRQDLENGLITREEAAEMIVSLLAQLRELSPFSDSVVIGGCDEFGAPFCNDISYFVLDGMIELGIANPGIGLRYFPGMPRELLHRGFELVRQGNGHPGFFSDLSAIKALMRAGFSEQDARQYVNCNCVELSAAGCSSVVSAFNYSNLVKPIEIMLNGGKPIVSEEHQWPFHQTPYPLAEIPEEFPHFEDFFATYQRYLVFMIDKMVEESNNWLTHCTTGTPMLLSSALIADCIDKAKPAIHGGARYNQTFPSFVGFGNAVDSLAAIRQAVYLEKRYTLDELADFCRNDFAGAEEHRQYLLKNCPKYGNNDACADELAGKIFTFIAQELAQRRNIFGECYGAEYFGFTAHGLRGQCTAATPDGRHAHEAVSCTLGGDYGTDINGPTALLRSATSYDQSLAVGGTSVNLAVTPATLQNDDDIEKMIDLLLAYFKMGGMQLQFNCVSAETLQQAEAQPEKFRNLLVRVAGYTDNFVDLDYNVRQQIINRMQHQF